MDQPGPQGLRTNAVVMETNNLRYPAAAVRVQPDDLSPRFTPSPHHCSRDASVLDGEKTGTTLLFTGVFLAIVGVIFTTMGWHNYLSNTTTFEWTQLLGPILISVGGTFVLTSVCKFGIISCWPCGKPDDEAMPATPVMEQNSTRHSFTLNGINQPIVLHSSTAMLCLPPVYDFITDFGTQWPGGSVNDVRAGVPPHVYCVDNAAFTAAAAEEEDSTETHCRRSRNEKTEDEGGRDDDSSSTCSRPPAYEDIYPSFTKPNLT
ncbi:Transmembrane protein 174 [Collichthys lucidus]|uniref:Transmembrane protein 174 n=1 Tax=Collichthys lucidus TaxID=240159 RepID=A0A4U5VAX8_COLLU|nr:Transmembrane protein 174 [Collichthys lucidus]